MPASCMQVMQISIQNFDSYSAFSDILSLWRDGVLRWCVAFVVVLPILVLLLSLLLLLAMTTTMILINFDGGDRGCNDVGIQFPR